MPVYKDSKRGTWYISASYVDWSGQKKRLVKRGFKLQKEALAYEREFFVKEKQSSDMLFSSLVELYFKDAEGRLRETTIENKHNLFDKHIIPYFGNLKINKIQPSHIRQWQSEFFKHDYAPTYLRTINNQISAIFNFAIKYYGLTQNPCLTAGSMGKKKAPEMEIWTLDEFERFINVVEKPGMKLAYEVMFWAGLRVGELLALFPRDIKEKKDKKLIDVNKTTTRKGGIDRFYDPKTSKSFRQVTIPTFLYNEIISYTSKLYGLQPDDQIFYFTKSALNKNLDVYAKKAGIKRIRVHDIRHSHASLCIEMGQPILLISQRLGHEKVETTWNTYAHLYPNKDIALAEELEKLRDNQRYTKSGELIDI